MSDWRYDYQPTNLEEQGDDKKLARWRSEKGAAPPPSKLPIILVIVLALIFSITTLWFAL